MSFLVGVALVVVIGSVVLNGADLHRLFDITKRADVVLLLVACVAQVGTYLAEAQVWRTISCRARCPLTFRKALALSFAKLFVDHSLPTGGVAGVGVAASALGRAHVSRPVVAATIIVERASFLSAYAIALAAALSLGAASLHLSSSVVLTIVAFDALSIAVAVSFVKFGGRRGWYPPEWMWAVRPLAALIKLLKRADASIVRRRMLLVRSVGLQLAVIALDAATMLTVVAALGAHLPFGAVFGSFMVSSTFRTIGILPGGLGTFEAASILTLTAAGATPAIAVGATLLFRGLSYWLPMAPGIWFARREALA